LNPSSQTFADIGIVSPFTETFGADVDDLYHELHQAKRLLQRMKLEDRPTTFVAFISHFERYGDAFAELHGLGVIVISLPVSNASCERMQLLSTKTYKDLGENSMSNEKLDCASLAWYWRRR